MCRVVLVNPFSKPFTHSRGGVFPINQARRQPPQQRSCLFVTLAILGLVVFGVTTVVVASLESLVEENQGPPSQQQARVLLASAPSAVSFGVGLSIIDETNGAETVSTTTASPTPPVAIVTKQLQKKKKSLVVSDDDFANSLGHVANQLLSFKSATPTTNPSLSSSSAEDAIDSSSTVSDDSLPDPPQPDPEEDDSLAVNTLIPITSSQIFSAAKSIHTCKYGKSEKTGAMSMSTWIWRFKKSAIGHDEYAKTPGSYRMSKIKLAIKLAMQDDWKRTPQAAGLAGYTLCRIDFQSQVVIAWQPRMRGDALFFTRHGYEIAPVILQVPHPQFDHTLIQGLQIFQETKARALVLSTSHRCSKALANKCTGNDGEPIKSNCLSRSYYHNSDAAHAIQTTFMAVHEELSLFSNDDLIVSLHSTKLDEFVVSDGTSQRAKHDHANVVVLAKELAVQLPTSKVGLCNEFDSGGLEWPSNLVPVLEEASFVCGATNVQGRHTNGALPDACKAKVSRSGAELTPTGRFIHIEQPVSLVKPDSAKSVRPPMSRPLAEAILKAVHIFAVPA